LKGSLNKAVGGHLYNIHSSLQTPRRKTEIVKDRESAWRAGGVLACQ